MRAYVITDQAVTTDDMENSFNVLGVTSSRKTALEACNEFLDQIAEQEEDTVTWHRKDKHVGNATCSDHSISYKMFFVNRIKE